MGVTLHYSGKIKSEDHIDNLIEEVIEVCHANDWKYSLINDAIAPDEDSESSIMLQGVIFSGEGGEPMWLTFDEDGNITSPMTALFALKDPDYFDGLEYRAFTKTQDAGPDYHMKLVKLIKYLSKKYFKEWKVLDESRYYEEEDESQLRECMLIIDRSLAALNDAFDVHGNDLGEKSPEEIKDFISKVLGSEATNIQVIKLDEEE